MLLFQIHYQTSEGESLQLHIKKTSTPNNEILTMVNNKSVHTLEYNNQNENICYRYELNTPTGIICEREFRSVNAKHSCTLIDNWRSPETAGNALYAKAFTQAMFGKSEIGKPISDDQKGKLVVRLREARIGKNEAFCIVSKQFINWDTTKAFIMQKRDGYIWEYAFEKGVLLNEIEFKFGIWDTEKNSFREYENGSNRYISTHSENNVTIITCDSYNHATNWQAAGVAVPVFSLRTHKDIGCGEFADLKPLADWCQTANLKIIQLLPINDTTATNSWLDSYPYNAISIMALHPIYISVSETYSYYGLKIKASQREEGLFINDSKFVDYEKTFFWKKKVLHNLFDNNFKTIMADSRLKKYVSENAWVADYAAFSALRDLYQTADFKLWPTNSKYSADDVKQMLKPNSKYYSSVWFYIFIQYHLELQLKDAIEYAHTKNVAFKGDLPIGINPCSVEAWVEPELFNFGLQAGAPPDFFSRDGQNWGFPTYIWSKMKDDNFAWWQKRLGRMQAFSDAFRIDHILGFFRIWAIPQPFKSGLMGHFEPALPFSSDELKQNGFTGNPEYFSRPIVNRQTLDSWTGRYAQQIDDEMFDLVGMGHRRMKAEFFNPEMTDKWVEKNVHPNDAEFVRNGLHNIIHEVFFMPAAGGKWHPRIMLASTELYKQMSQSEQTALRNLHDNYFYNRHNEFWKNSAVENLEGMLKNCDMLVCGEDLGMIPASVPVVMQRLQILSLEQQRMPKLCWERYGNCSQYQYMSVCATSSHDISSIRGWWEENYEETQYYYNNILKHSGIAPHPITTQLATEIIVAHISSPSMLCINPIQDYMAMDAAVPHLLPQEERINEPANPHHYWRFRVPFFIDDLNNYCIGNKIAELVKENNR